MKGKSIAEGEQVFHFFQNIGRLNWNKDLHFSFFIAFFFAKNKIEDTPKSP